MQQAIETLQEQIPRWLVETSVPGLSLALVEAGEILWAGGFGTARTTTGEAITADTVFEAASLTKPLFATAVMQMVTAGDLELDTPIVHTLPAAVQSAERLFDQGQDGTELLFQYVINEPRLQQLTLRHILSHTPGFPNWTTAPDPLRFFFDPGARFSYSGDGYNLLQKIVAQVTGQEPITMMQERLLDPLGMKNSGLTITAVAGLPLATPHDRDGSVVEKDDWVTMYAGGSLYSTPSDYARFLLALLNPEPSRPVQLPPDSIAQMWQPQVQVNTNMPWDDDWPVPAPDLVPAVAWGLGWGLQSWQIDGGEEEVAFWHWGDNDSFKAFTLGFPGAGTAVVMMANGVNGDKLWRRILATLFDTPQPALAWLGIP